MTISDYSAGETVIASTATDDRSYVDWPAIFAGALIATSISFVLLTFGSAVGLSMTSAFEGEGVSLTAFAIVAALWLIWVQVSGFFAGSYVAGRMRRRHFDATEHESDIRDGSHGITVWALGTLLGAFLAISSASSIVSGAASTVTTVATGAAAGAAGVASSMTDPSAIVDRLMRSGTAPTAAAPAGATPGAAAPADSRAEIGRLLLSSIGSETLDAADRDYLIATVARETGVTPEEATQRVDEIWTQVQQAEATARAAADRARQLSVLAAFMIAASTLISAVGAYFGAVMGGNHRDKQVVIEGWSRAS